MSLKGLFDELEKAGLPAMYRNRGNDVILIQLEDCQIIEIEEGYDGVAIVDDNKICIGEEISKTKEWEEIE